MQSSHPSPIPKIQAGDGRISLISYGATTVFSELSSTYPLKLLSPRIASSGVGVVYMLSYGGGLVGGDQTNISVNVAANAILVMLSQGSTKVFKTRPGHRLASVRTPMENVSDMPLITTQNLTFAIGGSLFLLPDPVTCFRSASYNQTQTFHLSIGASLVVLDWLTSGRLSMGEDWAFTRYYSANEVWVDGKRVAKDVMLLETTQTDPGPISPRSIRDRLAPYSCYAMVILCGPLVQDTIHNLASQYDHISVFKTKVPAEMIWSFSPMTLGGGWIVRVAGKETEVVKKWLGQALLGIQETIGTDVYRRAFL